MRQGTRIGAVIPALNEERSIGKVLAAIPNWVDDVVVVDNGSSDRTAEIAAEQGARVILEHRRGYGTACLAGIAQLKDTDIILFMDGDYSDYPQEAATLVDPIISDEADLVIGSRVLGNQEVGALTPQARFGNWLACLLMWRFWSVRYTDLGPFRAIGFDAFTGLHMRDPDYGWTVEMQIKAAKARLRTLEVPVSYRKRIGKSKVSGTVRGVVGAGTKILVTIFLSAVGLMPNPKRLSSPERIIVFTRYPQPGRVKTRLVPALGDEGAAEVHKLMTEHIVQRVRLVQRRRGVNAEVRFDGSGRIAISRWLGHGIDYRKQEPGDLGERMNSAFREAFESRSQRVILIGSDCPGITADLLESSLDALHEHDVVLGPAADGGYYLVGLKRVCPGLFSGMTWGTSDVLQQTLDRVAAMNLSAELLPTLSDVDRPEDLAVWQQVKDQADTAAATTVNAGPEKSGALADVPVNSGRGCRISVIVPTLNEAETLPHALASIGQSDDVEIVVVDGGSSDGTLQKAQELGVKAVLSRQGRGTQMNRGAKEATGDILLFLHADTQLPAGWADHVRRELARQGVSVGAFLFRTDGNSWSMRIIEFLANMRAKWFHLPYGDQALFVRADLFRHIGGFRDIPVMEDFEFVKQARKRGSVGIAEAHTRTSSRRWQRCGVWRTSLMNQVVILGHLLGIPGDVLSRMRGSESGVMRGRDRQ